MKRFLLLCLLLLAIAFCGRGQVNLVPNPSFEDTLGCPNGVPDLDGVCKNWVTFRGSPDYFNTCSSDKGFYNSFGYQPAHTGKAYAGLGEYQVTISNAREHIGVQLTSQLVIGKKYYLSFYVTSAYTYLYVNIATNKIGALLTTYNYYDPNLTRILSNNATLFTNTIIEDTVNWVKISGLFVADSAYQYLIIGNFFDDNHIDTLNLPYQIVPQASYYYLDDVCLSTDSIYCETWTGMKNTERKNNFAIYPNPARDILTIDVLQDYNMAEIYSINGELLLNEDLNNQQIDISSLPGGMYFIKLNTAEGSVVRKFVKE
jgi:hypothetical protein